MTLILMEKNELANPRRGKEIDGIKDNNVN